jgi:2-polyprenyl-6-hydroxyphenyl methylase/3-demethylubiquinone-9 3-methyltransferase
MPVPMVVATTSSSSFAACLPACPAYLPLTHITHNCYKKYRYQQTTLEDLIAADGAAGFDVVMASEVIEHVKRPQQFMASLAAATAPGGQVFVTTLNRTPASYALAIVGAEYLLRLVPAGTHSWTKFITPQELAMMAGDAGLRLQLLSGMVLQPGSGQFRLSEQDLGVNYAALMQKDG